jgi:hypothetical protein
MYRNVMADESHYCSSLYERTATDMPLDNSGIRFSKPLNSFNDCPDIRM